MGSCTRRHFLLSTCFLQMITIIERQVFDFLGYMWAPIFVNFFQILFVIFGFYGAYHFRVKYIITYLIWSFIWIGWNAFLICFYLNVGVLDRDSDLLNLGTGSFSWFEVNGYGCKPTYPTNITSDDPYRPVRPERVDDCLVDYHIVEVIQSSVQCALALLGIIGAILLSTIFLDEDDRFDFMNGDAKSPQHTVVRPMYVSIPTSASATLQSQKHHDNNPQQAQQQQQLHHNHNTYQSSASSNHYSQQQQQQQQQHEHNPNDTNSLQAHTPHPTPYTNSMPFTYQQQQMLQQAICNNNNTNTFLIHTNNNSTISGDTAIATGTAGGKRKRSSNSNTPIASRHATLTRQLSGGRRVGSSHKLAASVSGSAGTPADRPAHYDCYDDSTAKVGGDQQAAPMCASSQQRRHLSHQQQQQQQFVATPCSSHDNTSSLSYASLQNCNFNLTPSMRSGVGSAGGAGYVGSLGGGAGMVGDGFRSVAGGSELASPLSNSNYSLTSSVATANNNNNALSSSSSGRFARIHGKPRPPKSTSYSSFINDSVAGGGSSGISEGAVHRPEIKYTKMGTSERVSCNLEDDDNFSLRNFKPDGAVTYVPFTKPTPGALFVGNNNNNPSYASLHSLANSNNNNHSGSSASPNNNSHVRSGPGDFVLDNLAPLPPQRLVYQPNGMLPSVAAYSPTPYRHAPPRPTNIPLPTIPAFDVSGISPSEVTPPPPPLPRPHIFQPRSGQSHYPDLSPEVTERYAMPTQYVPRSPVASRIVRRQRQQQHERSQLANTSAHFCDQIRDTPPGMAGAGETGSVHRYSIGRAKSHDRLSASHSGSAREAKANGGSGTTASEAAPHVNRRSGRRGECGKARPRSYCNALGGGGEGVIRGLNGSGGGGTAEYAG